MKGFTSLLACGLFVAALSLSGCAYVQPAESPVFVPIPRTPPVEGAKKKGTSKCSVVGGHKYCTEIEEFPSKRSSEGGEAQAYCAFPANKIRWFGTGYVCEPVEPKGHFVPTTNLAAAPVYPCGYPYGFGYPFMPFMGPFWGGAFYGGLPVQQQCQTPQQQSQQSQLQQVLKQNQEILRRLDQK